MKKNIHIISPISHLRKEYTLAGLNEGDVDPDPFKQFKKWFDEALNAQLPEPTAMTLATATKEGRPSARIVLLKKFDRNGFVFFSNYESRKGKELSMNPFAALVFHWVGLERQVRITGAVAKVTKRESEAYFNTRPEGSQIAALASAQSRVIQDRKILEKRVEELTRQYRAKLTPLPPYWGGYRVAPTEIEFWQGRPSRLHDRLRYLKKKNGEWKIERLQP